MTQTPKPTASLRDQWWWFDSANAAEKTEVALAWETLRRTKSYPALWRKGVRERAAFLGDQPNPAGDESFRRPLTRKQFLAQQSRAELEAAARDAAMFRLMHLFQRLRPAISAPCFDFLMHDFDPALTWLEHSDAQRLTARGYVFGEEEAFKVNREFALPRQAPAPDFVPSIRLCPIACDSTGKVFVSLGTHFPQELVRVSACPFLRGLRIKKPSPERAPYFDGRLAEQCLSIYFDTRDGRDQLLATLGKQPEFWKPAPASGTTRLAKTQVRVIPSNDPPFAIFLAPATCTKKRLLAAFHTQLKAAQRKKWLPRCVRHWRSQRVESMEPVRNPDGTVQGDASGRPLRRKVIRPLFDPARHLRPKSNVRKSARRVDAWLGLAANDILEAGQALGKTSEDATFLLDRCGSLSELRNRQRAARRRLDELDTFFGRLDKNLAHWIQQNNQLAQMGCFTAATGEIA